MKTASVALVLGFACADLQHPVREEIVLQIKENASSWKPKEVKDNHLSKVSSEEIRGRFGNLGSSPSLFSSEFRRGVS